MNVVLYNPVSNYARNFESIEISPKTVGSLRAESNGLDMIEMRSAKSMVGYSLDGWKVPICLEISGWR